MKWKELSKNECEKIYYDTKNEKEELKASYSGEYDELRKLLLSAFNEVLKNMEVVKEELNTCNKKYKFDCCFGKKIYEIFTIGKYFIGERDASNNDFWRYIQMKVVPEIIRYRWQENLDVRLYKQSNRIYFKSLWWYYHLSFNIDLEITKEMLLNSCNNSDTIVQLVERSGKKGYRIELYREIMMKKSINNIGTYSFRKLMMLNSAKVKVINPYLVRDGLNGYVDELIEAIKGGLDEKQY